MELKKIKTKKFYKGNIIIREGDDVQYAYIINKGYVEIFKEVSKYDIRRVTQLGPGKLVGEMSLFGDKKSTASVRALTDVEVQVIDKKVFEEYLEQTPPLIKILLEILSNKLLKTSDNYLLVTQPDPSIERFKKAPQIDKIDFDSGKIRE